MSITLKRKESNVVRKAATVTLVTGVWFLYEATKIIKKEMRINKPRYSPVSWFVFWVSSTILLEFVMPVKL